LKDQTLSKGLDVGHIQIQTTFYKNKSKKRLSFLASSTFFKYAQNAGSGKQSKALERSITGTEINFYRQ
jgi:hypothetical protein